MKTTIASLSKKGWFVATALIGLLVLSGCEVGPKDQGPAQPRLVMATKVLDTSGLLERTFPGRAKASQQVNLSFRVSGPLITLPVAVGDRVKAGDVLARIDPNDYQARLNTLEGELETAQAQAVLSQKEYVRGVEIDAKGGGLISKSELDKRRGARDRSKAQVQALTASVGLAKDNLSYTELKAPFDGVIVATYVENFEDVLAKQPIVRLLNPTRIELDISVPESLIGYAPFVEEVAVRFDAFPDREIEAEVKEIGREASEATRTYPVTLVMNQPEGVEILPGMAGRASILSRPPDDSALLGIEIPATAVFSGDDPNSSFVWIIDEASKTLSRREVQIGKLAQFGVLVTDGLSPGEWIVVKGVHSVEEGQEVRILDATKADAPA
ncbi:MAG: efflux RND transporter periplasmic adaptor subunit [Chromatiaceae bacterium]|jgi:RND family efflux transporter MFP subunit